MNQQKASLQNKGKPSETEYNGFRYENRLAAHKLVKKYDEHGQKLESLKDASIDVDLGKCCAGDHSAIIPAFISEKEIVGICQCSGGRWWYRFPRGKTKVTSNPKNEKLKPILKDKDGNLIETSNDNSSITYG